MSLILQALKKSEKGKNSKLHQEQSGTFWEAAVMQYGKKSSKTTVLIIIFGCIILFLLGSATVYLYQSQQKLLSEIQSQNATLAEKVIEVPAMPGSIQIVVVPPTLVPAPTLIPTKSPTQTPNPTNTPTLVPIDLENDPSKALIVSGVMWDPSKPFAIVNSDLCEIGDVLKGFKIEKIEKNGIKVKGWPHLIPVSR